MLSWGCMGVRVRVSGTITHLERPVTPRLWACGTACRPFTAISLQAGSMRLLTSSNHFSSCRLAPSPLCTSARWGASVTRAGHRPQKSSKGVSRNTTPLAPSVPRRRQSDTTARRKSASCPAHDTATEAEDFLNSADADDEEVDNMSNDAVKDGWRHSHTREAATEEDDFSEDAIATEELDTTLVLQGRRRQTQRRPAEANEDENEDGDADTSEQRAGIVAEAAPESKYLVDAQPELAAEYVAAGKANKQDVKSLKIDSGAVVSWRCTKCQQKWKCAVFLRCILKNGCPSCEAKKHASIAAVRPDLVPLWHPHNNDPLDTPESVPADSRKNVVWICPTCRGHYSARVKNRVKDKAPCPSCAAQSESNGSSGDNSSRVHLKTLLVHEWHPLKNGDLQMDAVLDSGQPQSLQTKVWWLCSHCGHNWTASTAARLSTHKRIKGRACPHCHSPPNQIGAATSPSRVAV